MMIKKIVYTLLIILLLASTAYSARIVSFGSLTGGGESSLDAILCNDVNDDGVTEDSLQTDDRAFGVSDGTFYIYTYNATSTASESSPDTIVPDNRSDCGDEGAWELMQSISLKHLSDVSGTGTEGAILEDNGDGTFSFTTSMSAEGFIVPYGTGPEPDEEGAIYWNTSTKKLSVGDGESPVIIGP